VTRTARPALAPIAAGTTVVRRDSTSSNIGFGGGWSNAAIGLGGLADRESETVFLPGIPIPAFIVDALLQFNGMAKKIVEREAYDCTREGFTLGSDPVAEKLRKAAVASISGQSDEDNTDNSEDGVLNLVERARNTAKAYGGSAIVMLVDDGLDPRLPIDTTRIRKILGARVVTRWEISPMQYDRRPSSSRVGKPEIYQVTIGGVATIYVHHTRVIIFQGSPLPDHIMARQNGWGGSLYDLIWASLMRYQIVMKMLPMLARRQNQGVYKMAGLEAAVAGGFKGQIIDRFEGQQAGMGISGDIAIGENEEYDVLTRTITGMREIIEPLQMDVVANADGQPKLLVFGETPGGIKSGDNPEYIAWLDTCAGRQGSHYTGPVKRMCRLVALSHEGPTQGVVPNLDGFKWLPLYQPSQAEADASDLSRAQRRQLDMQGVVTVEEARTDPDVARLYPGLDPANAPASPGVEPEGEEPLDDVDESQPVVAADASKIPAGEPLIGIRRAARELGRSPGSIMRDAVANKYPIWRDGGRWKVAMSLVRGATQPHVFTAPALVPAAE
jgi:phage-related protein (TIGR01555 family)